MIHQMRLSVVVVALGTFPSPRSHPIRAHPQSDSAWVLPVFLPSPCHEASGEVDGVTDRGVTAQKVLRDFQRFLVEALDFLFEMARKVLRSADQFSEPFPLSLLPLYPSPRSSWFPVSYCCQKQAYFSIWMSSSLPMRLVLMVASVGKNPTMIRVTLSCGRALWRLPNKPKQMGKKIPMTLRELPSFPCLLGDVLVFVASGFSRTKKFWAGYPCGLVGPYHAILRFYRCDTPYRGILFQRG